MALLLVLHNHLEGGGENSDRGLQHRVIRPWLERGRKPTLVLVQRSLAEDFEV